MQPWLPDGDVPMRDLNFFKKQPNSPLLTHVKIEKALKCFARRLYPAAFFVTTDA